MTIKNLKLEEESLVDLGKLAPNEEEKIEQTEEVGQREEVEVR